MGTTKLRAALSPQLRAQDEPLITAQLRSGVSHTPQLLAQDHLCADVGCVILDAVALIAQAEHLGMLECGLDRAAPAERPPAISYTRQKAKLERICEMNPVSEAPTCLHTREHLGDCLAVAILEVLGPKAIMVNAQ